MTRPTASEQLSAFVDGELTDAEIAELEAELERDPALRAELSELEGMVAWVREEGPVAAPMGFHHRVMDRIEAEHPAGAGGSWWAWLRRPLGFPLEGWALAGAAALALILVLPRGEDPTTGPAEGASPAAVEIPALGELERPLPPAAAPPEADLPPPVARKDDVDRTAPTRSPPGKPSPPVTPTPVASDPVAGDPGASGTAGAPVVEPTAPTVAPGTAGPAIAAGYRLVVRSTDVEMKRSILALASRYGQATGADRREVTDATMSASAEDLWVTLPQAELSRFAADLKKLGFQVETVPTGALLGGDAVSVQVSLQLIGGATAPLQAAPNAARKRATEADDALEAPGEAR